MLGHCLRRWPNIDPSFVQFLMKTWTQRRSMLARGTVCDAGPTLSHILVFGELESRLTAHTLNGKSPDRSCPPPPRSQNVCTLCTDHPDTLCALNQRVIVYAGMYDMRRDCGGQGSDRENTRFWSLPYRTPWIIEVSYPVHIPSLTLWPLNSCPHCYIWCHFRPILQYSPELFFYRYC